MGVHWVCMRAGRHVYRLCLLQGHPCQQQLFLALTLILLLLLILVPFVSFAGSSLSTGTQRTSLRLCVRGFRREASRREGMGAICADEQQQHNGNTTATQHNCAPRQTNRDPSQRSATTLAAYLYHATTRAAYLYHATLESQCLRTEHGGMQQLPTSYSAAA